MRQISTAGLGCSQHVPIGVAHKGQSTIGHIKTGRCKAAQAVVAPCMVCITHAMAVPQPFGNRPFRGCLLVTHQSQHLTLRQACDSMTSCLEDNYTSWQCNAAWQRNGNVQAQLQGCNCRVASEKRVPSDQACWATKQKDTIIRAWLGIGHTINDHVRSKPPGGRPFMLMQTQVALPGAPDRGANGVHGLPGSTERCLCTWAWQTRLGIQLTHGHSMEHSAFSLLMEHNAAMQQKPVSNFQTTIPRELEQPLPSMLCTAFSHHM